MSLIGLFGSGCHTPVIGLKVRPKMFLKQMRTVILKTCP